MNQEIRFRLALDGVPVFKAGADTVSASLGQVSRDARQVAADANMLPGIFGATSDGLRQIAQAAAGGALVAGFVRTADAVTTLNNQLKLATGSAEAARIAYSSLFDIAQRSRTSFTELGATYASIARATSELGISQTRLLTVTEAIGNSLAISGGSAQGMQAALAQLGQGFASGALRGEELNSVMEQTPRLARAIADGLGISLGQLRELGKEGKLTAEAVLKALESQSATLAKEVQSSVLTVSQSFTQLSNAATKTVGEFDRVTGTSDALARAFQSAASGVQLLGDAISKNEEAFKIITAGIAGVAAVSGLSAVGGALAVIGARVAILGTALAANPAVAALLGVSALGGAAIAAGQAYSKTASGIEDSIRTLEQANARSEAAKERAVSAGRTAGADNISREITARTEQIRQLRMELAKLQGADPNADMSYLSGLSGGLVKTGKAAELTKDQLRDLAREQEKQQSVLNSLNGVTDDYVESVKRLVAMRMAGKLTEEQYVSLLDKLKQKQPAVIEDEKRRVAAAREYIGLQDLRAEGEREIAEAEAAAERARQQAVGQFARGVDALRDEAAAAELVATAQITHAQAIQRVTLRRLEDERVRLANDPQELAALERKIELQKQIVAGTDQAVARDAAAKAATDSAQEWERTANDIRSSLTNAFRESFRDSEDFGEAFAKNIGAELKARLATAVAEGLAGLVLQGLGIQGAVGQQQGGPNYMQLAQTGQTLYRYGANAYNWATGSGAAMYSTSAGTLGVTGAQGAFLGEGATSGVAAWEGAAAGSSAAGTSAAGSSVAATTWAALVVAALKRGSAEYDAGWTYEVGRDSKNQILGEDAIGQSFSKYSVDAVLTKLGTATGLSDKWASIFSGATAIAQLIGRQGPRVTEQGFSGTLAGGDFAGQAYRDILEKGGWFRSDKRYTETANLSAALESMLDAGASDVLKKAKEYGAALGLPVDALAQLSTDIKVTLTDDAAKNQAAITDALGGYGDQLVAAFADAVRPLAGYIDGVAETTAQTLQRVGASILGVNEVLGQLGLAALKASVDGGRAATELEALFGGLNTLQQAAGSYLQAYYTDAERANLATQGIARALAEFGLQVPTTRDGFRSLVQAQDLTTTAGREAFAALMGVADAFASIVPAARSAADILAERLGLERELLTLQGNTAELRARERAQLDESNRALYDQIKALEDQRDAAELAAKAADQMAEVAQRLAEQAKGIGSTLLQGVGSAYGAVESTIDAERQRVNAQADADIQALEQQAQAMRQTWQGLFDALAGSIDQINSQLAGDGGRGSAVATLQGALADLRSGRTVDQDAIRNAAARAAQLPASGFASQLDYQRELAKTANLLRDIGSAGRTELRDGLRDIAIQQVEVEQQRDAQLAVLDDQLAQARAAAERLVSIDDGIKTVAQAIAQLSQAVAAVDVANGLQGPVGQWLRAGGAEVFKAPGGAIGARPVGASVDETLIRGINGEMFTGAQARAFVQDSIAAGDFSGLVARAIAVGIDSTTLDQLMGYSPGTAIEEARKRNLPAFETGSRYVPQTSLALVHQGERIVTASENADLMRLVNGSGGAGLSDQLVRQLLAVLQEHTALLDGIADHTSRTAANTRALEDQIESVIVGDESLLTRTVA